MDALQEMIERVAKMEAAQAAGMEAGRAEMARLRRFRRVTICGMVAMGVILCWASLMVTGHQRRIETLAGVAVRDGRIILTGKEMLLMNPSTKESILLSTGGKGGPALMMNTGGGNELVCVLDSRILGLTAEDGHEVTLTAEDMESVAVAALDWRRKLAE